MKFRASAFAVFFSLTFSQLSFAQSVDDSDSQRDEPEVEETSNGDEATPAPVDGEAPDGITEIANTVGSGEATSKPFMDALVNEAGDTLPEDALPPLPTDLMEVRAADEGPVSETVVEITQGMAAGVGSATQRVPGYLTHLSGDELQAGLDRLEQADDYGTVESETLTAALARLPDASSRKFKDLDGYLQSLLGMPVDVDSQFGDSDGAVKALRKWSYDATAKLRELLKEQMQPKLVVFSSQPPSIVGGAEVFLDCTGTLTVRGDFRKPRWVVASLRGLVRRSGLTDSRFHASWVRLVEADLSKKTGLPVTSDTSVSYYSMLNHWSAVEEPRLLAGVRFRGNVTRLAGYLQEKGVAAILLSDRFSLELDGTLEIPVGASLKQVLKHVSEMPQYEDLATFGFMEFATGTQLQGAAVELDDDSFKNLNFTELLRIKGLLERVQRLISISWNYSGSGWDHGTVDWVIVTKGNGVDFRSGHLILGLEFLEMLDRKRKVVELTPQACSWKLKGRRKRIDIHTGG